MEKEKQRLMEKIKIGVRHRERERKRKTEKERKLEAEVERIPWCRQTKKHAPNRHAPPLKFVCLTSLALERIDKEEMGDWKGREQREVVKHFNTLS